MRPGSGFLVDDAGARIRFSSGDSMKQPGECSSVVAIPDLDSSERRQLLLLCDGLIESAWLGALMVTPLLLNAHGVFGGFTPFKDAFLRFCMLLGLGAAAIRWAAGWRSRRDFVPGARRWWRSPPALFLALLVIALVASWSFSVNRSASFWGGYETSHGVLSWVCGIILMALIATHLRRESQLERLVTVVLVTSFAVSLTALAQRFGWDPSHPEMAGQRATSTVGQEIALGDYLMMVCPLTLWRLWTLWTGKRPLSSAQRLTGLVFHLLLLAAQLAGFLAAESRGPFLGMLTATLALTLFWAGYWRRGWLVWVILAAVCAAAISGLWLAGHGALSKYARLPGIRNFGNLVSLQNGSETYRSELWSHLPGIVFGREPFVFPDGRLDTWHNLRIWLGYGPETVECITPHYFTNYNTVVENRCHNLIWDLLCPMGLLGLVAYLGLVCTTLGRGLSGFFLNARDSMIFWGAALLLPAGVGIALSLWVNTGFFGPGWMAGFVAWFTLVTPLFMLRGGSAESRALPGVRLLVLALLAIVLGHLTDCALAFATVPAGTFFWACLGLILALSRGSGGLLAQGESRVTPVGEESSDLARALKAGSEACQDPRGSIVLNSVLTTLGLVTLLFGFVRFYSDQPFTIHDVLSFSLWHTHPGEFRASLLLAPVAAFWLCASLMLSLGSGTRGSLLRDWAATAILSGAAALAYALVKAWQITAIGPLPSSASAVSSVLDQAHGYDHLYTGFAVLSLLLVVLAGLSMPGSRRTARSFSLGELCALAAAGLVFCCAISPLGLRRLRADLYAQWGEILADGGQAEAAVTAYLKALEMNPQPPIYRGLLQQALVECARGESDPARARQRLELAAGVLEQGIRLNSLNRLHFVLGQTCLLAAFSEQGQTRLDFAARASRSLAAARIFEPFIESVWTYGAIARELQPDNSHESEKLRQRARTIASTNFFFWGDYYSALVQDNSAAELRTRLAYTGLEYLDAGLKATNLTAAGRARFALAKARILLATNRQPEAIQELLQAETGARPEEAWQIEMILADFDLQLSNFSSSREHLELARKNAPRDKLPMIKEFENRLPPR